MVLSLQRRDIIVVEIKTERGAVLLSSHGSHREQNTPELKCSTYPSSAGQMDQFRVTQGVEFSV